MRDEVGNTALNTGRPSASRRPEQLVEKQNKLQKSGAETRVPQTSDRAKEETEEKPGKKHHLLTESQYPKISRISTCVYLWLDLKQEVETL